MLPLSEILTHFAPAKRIGKDYRTVCPVHGDSPSHPSLSIAEGDHAILFKCETRGCPVADIIGAASPPLTWRDIFAESNGNGLARLEIYRATFHDEHGTALYDSIRYHPKSFAMQAANGSWSMHGVRRVLYRLPEIQGLPTLCYVEGPQKADALWRLGIPTTTHIGGAKAWKPFQASYAGQMTQAGCHELAILRDTDPPGLAMSVDIATTLTTAGISVRIVTLPGLTDKQDILDFLASGRTAQDIRAAIASAPIWTEGACAVCGSETCTDHLPPPPPALDPTFLADAIQIIREGQQIAETGIRYLVDGLIPNYGMLGMLVAFAKVGKTTFGQALAAAVAMGHSFLDRTTQRARVLIIAAEDPPEYTAYLARTLNVEAGQLTFYRAPIVLNADGLKRIRQTVTDGHYGLTLIASWQAVVRGIVRDENDNAGSAALVEAVKAVTRATKIPWLIDAHSGKGEDQTDEADPSKAMRGASAAAAAADYTLSLRYADGPFTTRRRLSGKGRFVNVEPLTLEYDLPTGAYSCLGGTKEAAVASTRRLIFEVGAVNETPRSATEIARLIGLIGEGERLSGTKRQHIYSALAHCDGVLKSEEIRRGKTTTLFRFVVN